MAEGGEDELDLRYLLVKDDDLSVPLEEEQRKERRWKEVSGGNTSATQKNDGQSYEGLSSKPKVMEQGSQTAEKEEFFYNAQRIEKTCKEAFNTGGVAGLNELLKTKLSQWKKVPVNIAVVGISGSGKSTFINAMRDLKWNDSEAAKVGLTETTVKISRYVHPKQRNISFWDFPGIGTPSYPQELYEEKINNVLKGLGIGVQNISELDFFIIVTASRFTEHDQWLAETISNRYQKMFYFVRTHVDATIYNERHKSQGGPYKSDDEIKQEILKYIKENLHSVSCAEIQIFLIDNYNTKTHDFDKLRQCLFKDAPESKREALVFTLSGFSEEMIEIKRSLFLDQLYLSSLKCISSLISTIAVVNQIRFIKEQFGVTAEELSEYANKLDIFPLNSQEIKCTDKWVRDTFSSNYFMGLTAVLRQDVPKKLWIAALGVIVITEWWKSYQLLKMVINTCADDAKKIQKAILRAQGTTV